jgi:hypothetical protein
MHARARARTHTHTHKHTHTHTHTVHLGWTDNTVDSYSEGGLHISNLEPQTEKSCNFSQLLCTNQGVVPEINLWSVSLLPLFNLYFSTYYSCIENISNKSLCFYCGTCILFAQLSFFDVTLLLIKKITSLKFMSSESCIIPTPRVLQ